MKEQRGSGAEKYRVEVKRENKRSVRTLQKRSKRGRQQNRYGCGKSKTRERGKINNKRR